MLNLKSNMLDLKSMTIIEMMEYAKNNQINLPSEASKSEILRLILPSYLDKKSMQDIRSVAQYHCVHIPMAKNKSELIKMAVDSYVTICTYENYEDKFKCALNNFQNYLYHLDNDNDSSFISKTIMENEKLIDLIDKPLDKPSDNQYALTILSNPNYTQKYLLHLINLETEIDFLKKYLFSLQNYSYYYEKNRHEILEIYQRYVDNKTIFETYDLVGRIEFLRHIQQDRINYPSKEVNEIEIDGVTIANPKFCNISKPKKPAEPVAPTIPMPVPPTSPTYKKPNFFNKKKIDEENFFLKKTYEIELKQYRENLKIYENEQDLYNQTMTKYKSDFESYKKSLQKYNDKIAEQKKQAIVYKEALSKLEKQQSETIEKEIQAIETKIQAICDKNYKEKNGGIYENAIEDTLFKFLSEEQKKVKQTLKETVKARNALASYNVVFDKYRELPILTTLYEYLISGRCSDLRGADGGYNLYESELRSNTIINKLDSIEASLETIKTTQRMLYNELQQVNDNLEKINSGINNVINSLMRIDNIIVGMDSKLEFINKSLKSIDTSMQATAQNTLIAAQNSENIAHYSEIIAYNSQITAYNTAMNAHYSRINACMLSSINFMTAFK